MYTEDNIKPDKLSQGRLVRRWIGGGDSQHDRDAEHVWLCGWDGLYPEWTENDAGFMLVSKECADYVEELYPGRIRVTQPFWYAGKASSEGQAIRDIWGHDYVRHKMGW